MVCSHEEFIRRGCLPDRRESDSGQIATQIYFAFGINQDALQGFLQVLYRRCEILQKRPGALKKAIYFPESNIFRRNQARTQVETRKKSMELN